MKIRVAGGELRRIREANGLSQRDLADAMGKTQGFISMAEAGLDVDKLREAIERAQAGRSEAAV